MNVVLRQFDFAIQQSGNTDLLIGRIERMEGMG